ncbi:MAG: hypothetical protein ACRD1T_08760 [Acidimicrobiia bacterium]
MKARRALLVVAVVGSSLFLTAPSADAQYCADDDYSASCRAQRQCESMRDELERKGIYLISCTQ